MIEGCIVAKLVLGYLTDEGFHRTCSAFQDECSLFHGGNSELDQVLLTADLKTILEDYSQLKEKGRENGIPTSTAVLKSLWKDLDVVIGQLKYATIPTGAPKLNSMGSQATRTRRLNIGRSRRNMLQKNQQHAAKTVTNSPTIPCSSTPSLPENNANEKLPLPRVSTAGVAHNTCANSSQSPSANRRAPSVVQSTANKDINIRQTSSVTQPVGGAVPVSVPVISCNGQLTGIPSSCLPSTAPSGGNSCTNNEQSRNTDATEGMFDVMIDVDVYNDGDVSHSGADQPSAQPAPVTVTDDENSQNQHVVDVEEHSLSCSNLSQKELQLRSPKRKGVQPKKRVPQSASGISAVHDSPMKPVPWSANQEVETDIMCSPDSLTPESFLGTLLSTPLLQEKLAENINKVVSSSRVQPASDELPSAATQSMTTTEASSDDVLMASNQEAGGDIPVKEIMDLMQADPAFDVLFSFFGLDALNALPSATNSSTELPEKPADSNLFGKSTSSLSTSESQIQDTLGALPSVATGTVSDFGNGITILPGSNQHLHTPCSASDFRDGNTTLQVSNQQPLEHQGSSSASGLHLSATSIVTDALLLLAGSPQKKTSSQVTSQLSYCTNAPISGQHNPDTPSRGAHSVDRSLANDNQPCRESTVNQPALITSTLPYVRALKFTEGNETIPRKRGRKKGSKNENDQKQNTKINKQSKTPANKKGANIGRQRIIAKKPPEPTATSFSKSASCSTFANSFSINKPLTTYGSTLNSTSLPHPSPANVIMPNSSPNPAPDSFVNFLLPVSTTQPVNVISSSPSPVCFTDAVGHGLASPVNHITMVTSAAPSPVSFNNISTCPTPTPANFTPSSSVHTPTPFALRNFPICSPPVSLPTTDQPNSPSVVPVVCPLPSSVCPVSTHTSHSPLPASLAPLNVPAISDETLVTQAVNIVTLTKSTGLSPAVIPGHYTDSTVSSATAKSVGNLTTSVEDDRIKASSGLGPSMSRETVDAGADDLSTSSEPLSLQASNLLQTLALKHANYQKNVSSPCNLVSGSNNEQVGAESLRNNIPHSSVVEVTCQPLKENSTSLENVNVSKDNIDVSSKKHNGHDSSSLNAMERELRETVPGETSLNNSLENMNDSTSSLAMLNQECSELMKENSVGFSNSQTNGERGMKGSSNPARKRQRDSIHLQKKKRSKSSRPSKRSKTQEEGINFPSDLNVEEFLAKLHYEHK